jgi:hypothetical protein
VRGPCFVNLRPCPTSMRFPIASCRSPRPPPIIITNSSVDFSILHEQTEIWEKPDTSDFGVSTGLISQGHWEASKWYFSNVERGNIADNLQPRNINVSFTKNSNVAIDILIFTFYSDQLVIDVETGIVNK